MTVRGLRFTAIEKVRKNDGMENHDFGADRYRMVVEGVMTKAQTLVLEKICPGGGWLETLSLSVFISISKYW